MPEGGAKLHVALAAGGGAVSACSRDAVLAAGRPRTCCVARMVGPHSNQEVSIFALVECSIMGLKPSLPTFLDPSPPWPFVLQSLELVHALL